MILDHHLNTSILLEEGEGVGKAAQTSEKKMQGLGDVIQNEINLAF